MQRLSALTLPVVFIIGVLLTALAFGRFFLHPNDYLFTPGGDGLKNYYTPAWYIKYDDGLHFSGMNAPFGEHVTFTDNQPAVSIPLNFIDDHIIELNNQTIGILNMLMLLSLPFCAVFVYLLLRRFMLPSWYAAFCALIIAFLSPQLGRFMGHYALAYSFFVPLCWLLALRMNDNRGSRSAMFFVLLCLVLILFGLIHLYYLLMGSAFLLAYTIVSALSPAGKNKSDWLWGLARNAGVALLPFLFVLLFLKLTDSVSDRPAAPYGFTHYAAGFESIFLPSSSPFAEVWKFFIHYRIPDFEGRAYVGLPGLLVLLFLLYRGLRGLLGSTANKSGLRKKSHGFGRSVSQKSIHLGNNRHRVHRLPANFGPWIAAAVLVLLFAMAIPFRWGLEGLLDLFPPIKQFRSPGRLAWVFYYVWTVFTAYYFYRLYRYIARRGLPGIGLGVLFAFLFLWGLEATANVKNLRNYLYGFTYENPFGPQADTYSSLLDQAGRKGAEFQGMLCLPYYMMGSEKLYIDRGADAMALGMQASYQTGIPLMQGMLSRTSYKQTVKLVQLVSNPHIRREILPELGGKPILVMAIRGQLNRQEADIIGRGHLIAGNNEVLFYEVPVSAFASDQVAVLKQFADTRDSLFETRLQGDEAGMKVLTSSQPKFCLIESFENGSEKGLLGKSAFYQNKGTARILDMPVDLPVGTALEFSVWVKAYIDKAAFPRLWLRQYNSSGELLGELELNPKQSTDAWGSWVRIASDFEPKEGAVRLECIVKGERIGVDALMIRSLPSELYFGIQEDGSFFYNNWPILAAECGC